MNFLETVGERPALALIVAGIVLGVLVVARALRGGAGKEEEAAPGLDALVAAGRYRDAAMLCLRHERFSDAQEYFLRANEPARAAHVAQRLGNHKLAAELYERGGELRKAAACFERIGQLPKAQELLNAAAERDGLPAPSREAPRAAPKPAEANYRAMKAKGAADDAGRVEAQQAAQRAGEEALASGDIRAAAEIYRDAGLADEAIHLYANVLGAPGDAAPLVAARGHHDRAAELYEQAGQKDRAAAAWVEMARKEGRVEPYVDRVARLEPRAALRMLEDATASRAPGPESAEVFYRYGEMLERLGDRVRALEVMLNLQRTVAGYKDVDARVRALAAARRDTPVKDAPAPARAEGATPATVVVQHIQVSGSELRPEDAQALAKEGARAASAHRPGGAPAGDGRTQSVVVVQASELQRRSLLHDAEVQAAREGPTLEALRRYVGDSACTLKNIEVYYKMGLVCLASGDWGTALQHFQSVEEASPGYRDAATRASEIRAWQHALGSQSRVASGVLQAAAPGGATRYQLHGELGRGGMAVVYRATDTVLGRDVALKFIADEALGRREFREMFLREARSVAQLNHPNIVTIYDVGSLEGRTFLAMELVEGKTLEHLVTEQKKLSVVEALRVTLQVLQALEYAHGRQIIHRDIKPSNMMRAASGLVKLMDFGLAKSVDGSAKASVIAGTPAYMPPEQFAGQNVDHRADLYAVGVSLYEMLTGELPFTSPLRSGEVPSVRAVAPQVPALVDDVLRRVLEVDPARRFQSARELAAPLQKVLAVFDRAQEERDARRTHSLSTPTPQAAPIASAQTIAAQRPLVVKAPTQAAPAHPPAPAAKPTPAAQPTPAAKPAPMPQAPPAAERTSEGRKQTILMAPAQAAAQPAARPAAAQPAAAAPPAAPAKPASVTPDAWSLPPAAPLGFQSKKGTMLMHAAPPSASRAAAQNAASDTGGARKATMMMGAAHAAATSRRSSTIPPPA